MPREELERLEVSVVEGLSIVAVGHAQDAARIVADEDRHADEGVGAVAALPGLDRRARDVTHEERALRLCNEADDAFTGLDPNTSHHVLRKSDRARDHEVGRVVLAQKKRRALTAHELRGDLEYGVEQVFCSPRALTVHVPP